MGPGAIATNHAYQRHANAQLYPCWLWAKPQVLLGYCPGPHYQGALTLLVEPHRLETGWLDGDVALRGCCAAGSPQADLVWIYRERLQESQPQDQPCQATLYWTCMRFWSRLGSS